MSLQPILGDTVCDDMYLSVHVHRQSCVNLRMQIRINIYIYLFYAREREDRRREKSSIHSIPNLHTCVCIHVIYSQYIIYTCKHAYRCCRLERTGRLIDNFTKVTPTRLAQQFIPLSHTDAKRTRVEPLGCDEASFELSKYSQLADAGSL